MVRSILDRVCFVRLNFNFFAEKVRALEANIATLNPEYAELPKSSCSSTVFKEYQTQFTAICALIKNYRELLKADAIAIGGIESQMRTDDEKLKGLWIENSPFPFTTPVQSGTNNSFPQSNNGLAPDWGNSNGLPNPLR